MSDMSEWQERMAETQAQEAANQANSGGTATQAVNQNDPSTVSTAQAQIAVQQAQQIAQQASNPQQQAAAQQALAAAQAALQQSKNITDMQTYKTAQDALAGAQEKIDAAGPVVSANAEYTGPASALGGTWGTTPATLAQEAFAGGQITVTNADGTSREATPAESREILQQAISSLSDQQQAQYKIALAQLEEAPGSTPEEKLAYVQQQTAAKISEDSEDKSSNNEELLAQQQATSIEKAREEYASLPDVEHTDNEKQAEKVAQISKAPAQLPDLTSLLQILSAGGTAIANSELGKAFGSIVVQPIMQALRPSSGSFDDLVVKMRQNMNNNVPTSQSDLAKIYNSIQDMDFWQKGMVGEAVLKNEDGTYSPNPIQVQMPLTNAFPLTPSANNLIGSIMTILGLGTTGAVIGEDVPILGEVLTKGVPTAIGVKQAIETPWNELNNSEKIVAAALNALWFTPIIESGVSKISISSTDIPLQDGSTANVWKGLSVDGNPIVGVSKDGVIVGTGKVQVPEGVSAEDILDGYKPVSKVDTTIYTSPKIQEQLGLTDRDIDAIKATLSSRDAFAGKSSPYQPTGEVIPVKAMSMEAQQDVFKILAENSKDITRYGSGPMMEQIDPSLKGFRQPADIDVTTTLPGEKAEILAKKLADAIAASDGAENVLITERGGFKTLIDTKRDGKFDHAIDLHAIDEKPDDIVGLSAKAASQKLSGRDMFYGRLEREPFITVDYPGIGKIKMQSLSETGSRKAASILEMNKGKISPPGTDVSEDGIVSPSETGKPRYKDITDFYVIDRSFFGEAHADEWAKKYGYDPNTLWEAAQKNPPKVEWTIDPNSKSQSASTKGSSTITISPPSGMGSPIVVNPTSQSMNYTGASVKATANNASPSVYSATAKYPESSSSVKPSSQRPKSPSPAPASIPSSLITSPSKSPSSGAKSITPSPTSPSVSPSPKSPSPSPESPSPSPKSPSPSPSPKSPGPSPSPKSPSPSPSPKSPSPSPSPKSPSPSPSPKSPSPSPSPKSPGPSPSPKSPSPSPSPKSPGPGSIRFTGSDGKKVRLTEKQLEGALAWKQGLFYQVRWQPFGAKDVFYSREPVPGVKYFDGIGSAAKSAVDLYGEVPQNVRLDMGIVDINITRGQDFRKPILKFKADSKQKTHYNGIEKGSISKGK